VDAGRPLHADDAFRCASATIKLRHLRQQAARPPKRVIDADYRVTFVVDNWGVSDPSFVEAARLYRLTNYDKQIGLWDLAKNEVLQATLLKPYTDDPEWQEFLGWDEEY
jgi:hypothetical protein